jgi:hypothetical protein
LHSKINPDFASVFKETSTQKNLVRPVVKSKLTSALAVYHPSLEMENIFF